MELDKIRNSLGTEIVGNSIYIFEEVDSTNNTLYKLGEESAADGTVIISETQTDGRGRLDRSWYSPGGINLYTSILFRPKISVSEAPVFTFIASLALMDTFEAIGVFPQIKWPNDLIAGGKKLAGVLTEMKQGKGHIVDFVVVGIGANLNMKAGDFSNVDGVSDIATSAYEILGYEIDRNRFTRLLLESLENHYSVFLYEGVHSIVANWTNRWGNINKSIKVISEGNTIEGIVKKVDRSGYLYVETPEGNLEKVITGDTLF